VQFALSLQRPLVKGVSSATGEHGCYWRLREILQQGRRAKTNLNSPEKTMNAVEVAQRQIDAWNRHDADAVTAGYAEDATYHTPRFDHPVKGRQAIGDWIKSVLKAYPDIRFEVISSGDIGGGLVAMQLVLHATNTGPFMDGTPPTGRTVTYPLASFAQVEGNKYRSEHIYLDRQGVAEQLGLTPKKT